MPKTIAQISEGLDERYAGLTYLKGGFEYIPWNLAAGAANRVFGIDGYDVELVSVEEKGEGYAAKVRVTVRPSDAPAFFREGIGYNEVQGQGGRAHDTAVKGAASDGLNRALKLFGPAFGLHLYDKGDSPESGTAPTPNNNTATQPRPVQSSGGSDRGPSEGQLRFAASLGYTAEEFTAMPWQERKGILDNKVRKPVAKATARVASKPVEESLASMAAAMLDEDAA